ncbi:MAG TPA: hypothetical protein VGG75_22955 [Trebonia sp.]|jgi:NAD(P)H-dependent FMN reductase
MPGKQRVAVVIGSSRPTRICAGIAAWTRDTIQRDSELYYEPLDRHAPACPATSPRSTRNWPRP